jgi:hypothetical protein
MPVTAGLAMASAALLIKTTSAEWGTAAITRVHPLLVLATAAALGATSLLV